MGQAMQAKDKHGAKTEERANLQEVDQRAEQSAHGGLNLLLGLLLRIDRKKKAKDCE